MHMQLLCLSHDYHMTSEMAVQLADSLHADIRRVFLSLQFLTTIVPTSTTHTLTPPTPHSSLSHIPVIEPASSEHTSIYYIYTDQIFWTCTLYNTQHQLGFSTLSMLYTCRLVQEVHYYPLFLPICLCHGDQYGITHLPLMTTGDHYAITHLLLMTTGDHYGIPNLPLMTTEILTWLLTVQNSTLMWISLPWRLDHVIIT